jgi:hypothetical protein
MELVKTIHKPISAEDNSVNQKEATFVALARTFAKKALGELSPTNAHVASAGASAFASA